MCGTANTVVLHTSQSEKAKYLQSMLHSFFLSRTWVFMRWGSPTSLGIISSCSSSMWVPRILLEEILKEQVVTARCKERGWGSRGVTLNPSLFFQLWFKGKTVAKTSWKWAFVCIKCSSRRAWVHETLFYKLLHRCSVHLVKKWRSVSLLCTHKGHKKAVKDNESLLWTSQIFVY